MDDDTQVKPTTRRRKRHRCINCKKEMPCPARCLHDFEVESVPLDRERRLGLCRACITKLSRRWPPGYPVDEEVRALVYVAQSLAVDVRHLLASAALEAHKRSSARLRSLVYPGPFDQIMKDLVDGPVARLFRKSHEEEVIGRYLTARAAGVGASDAAAAALVECPSLKSAGNVRRRASLLRRETAQVTKTTPKKSASRSRRRRSE